MSQHIIDLEILGSQLHGEGGFSRLRRVQVRNVRADGSRSATYSLDMVERPGRADAVTVIAYEPAGDLEQTRVLLRRGLRPVARLGRAGQPTRDGVEPPLDHVETVAGILEPDDDGEDGLRRRAAAELREEAGIVVAAAEVRLLGPPVQISVGIMAERLYFCCVATRLPVQPADGAGDGSPLEEGSEGLVLSLGEALRRCRAGDIRDGKTELALRRLAEALARAAPPDSQATSAEV